MLVPAWLLILIVVILVSIVLPGIRDVLSGLAFVLGVLLVLASIPASLYFFSHHGLPAASIVSLPWVAGTAWVLWFSGVKRIKTSLSFHRMRVRLASKPEIVEQLRRDFADELDLGRKMWQFRDDVKYFPSWRDHTISNGTAGVGDVVRDGIREVYDPEAARAAGLDSSTLNVAAPFVVYSFSSDDKAYAFCTRDRVERYGVADDADGVCGVWVVEKPDRVVLSMRLSYCYGQSDDTYSGSYLEAFKADSWLPTLLGIIDRVHRDEQHVQERWLRQFEGDNARNVLT
jgi:hypothetical protein